MPPGDRRGRSMANPSVHRFPRGRTGRPCRRYRRGPGLPPRDSRPAVTPVAAVADQLAAVAAVSAGGAGPAGPAVPAVSDPPCVAAGPAGLTRGAGGAVAAVPVQPPAVRAATARHRRVGSVADQRSPGQRLGGRIHHAEQQSAPCCEQARHCSPRRSHTISHPRPRPERIGRETPPPGR